MDIYASSMIVIYVDQQIDPWREELHRCGKAEGKAFVLTIIRF